MTGYFVDWILGFQLYLPIAEMTVPIVLLLGLGALVGFLSGLFGVGGGFLMTPLLILMGVPPTVAVATQSNQIVATSVSGVLAHWTRGNVDGAMGIALLAGGSAGSGVGVALFSLLRHVGQIDVVINIAYVVMLGAIGIMMTIESIHALRRVKIAAAAPEALRRRWIQRLPWKMRFRKSRLYISVWVPIGIGFFVGVLSSLLGVGGAFMLVPAMIYIVGMPTMVVVGTSLFQIIFVAAISTILHSVENRAVDVMLALVLTVGSVFGVQFGSRTGAKLPAEQLRFLLALLILCVAAGLLYISVARPESLFDITIVDSR